MRQAQPDISRMVADTVRTIRVGYSSVWLARHTHTRTRAIEEAKYWVFKMAWSKHLLLVLFAIINEGSSVNIGRCHGNRVTIVEGRNDSITCSGISTARNVLWKYRSKDDEFKYFGQCDSDNSCDTENTDVILSRKSDRSSLFLLGNERKYGEVEVQCEQVNLFASNNIAVCTMSVTSVAKFRGCDAAFDVASWSMNVSCLLYHMFTSFGFYACFLVLDKKTTPGYDSLHIYTDGGDGKVYVSGTCSFTARLPTEEGEYKYYIATIPPHATNSENTLIIDRPGDPDVSFCPRYVQATANVTCLCDVNPTGNPPADVWWEGEGNTATLVLINVQRNDSDRRFTCNLSWGAFRRSTSYQLRVAHGPETVNISSSTFWISNHLKFANLTCKATGYSPDVTYVWNVLCQSEALVDHASVCSTSFQDQQTKVTCTAANAQFPDINATAVMTVYLEGEIRNSKETGLIGAGVGGALGIITIVSLCAGLAVYLKRRKVSEFVDHTNETYMTSSDASSTEIHNATRFDEKHDGVCKKDPATEKQPRNISSVSRNTWNLLEKKQKVSICSDIYAVPDKRTKGREGSSRQQIRLTSSAVSQPASLPVSRIIQTEGQCLDGVAGSSQNIPGRLYENVDTCRINVSKVQKRFSEESKEAVQKEEIQPQPENDGVEYNRLDFSKNIRLSESLTESAPVYDHLNDV